MAINLADAGSIAGPFPKRLVYERIYDHPMLGNDWLLSYEAERTFGFRLKGKNRADYSVFGDLIHNDGQFYDKSAIPIVLQGVDDVKDVDEALEDRLGVYEEDDFEDFEDDMGAF